jgi:hypothetical protein
MAIDKDKLIEYYKNVEEILTNLRESSISADSATSKLEKLNDEMKELGFNLEVSTDFIDDIESNKSYEYEESYSYEEDEEEEEDDDEDEEDNEPIIGA